MFGMVLAIGLLVDDAIVVVENVERVMSEEGLSPREATRKSMDQITGALVGIALVLSAVFVPMAFFGGSVGVIYRQFSITLVSAMVLSVVVALVLTPALCATLLKPVHAHHSAKRALRLVQPVVRARRRALPEAWCGGWSAAGRRAVLAYLAVVAVLALLLVRMPTGFLPDEDQGTMIVQVQLPPGATLERTRAVVKEVTEHFLTKENGRGRVVFGIVGFSFAGRSQNGGIAFVRLKDWEVRHDARLAARAVAGESHRRLPGDQGGVHLRLHPARRLRAGQRRRASTCSSRTAAGPGTSRCWPPATSCSARLRDEPAATRVRPNGLDDTPQYKIDVDWQKAAALGLSFGEINANLASTWGGSYVNDFIDRGRVKKVYMQGDAPFRMQPDDLDRWYVRNRSGQMVPFSAFATGRWTYGSPRSSASTASRPCEIQGEPAPGAGAPATRWRRWRSMAAQLPPGIGVEWTGLSFEERHAPARQAAALYGISLLVVFLCLAALYESWSIPFVGHAGGAARRAGRGARHLVRGLANDVYFQVGLLTTIGLSAKNAILIVEFAKRGDRAGMTWSRPRSRPPRACACGRSS